MEESCHLCECRSARAGRENSMGSRNGLENKRVVVLGGSSGIGLAVAEAATSHGARVIIGSSNARRSRLLEETRKGRHSMSRTNGLLKASLQRLAHSITWFTRPPIACSYRISLARTSRGPGASSRCATGLPSLRSNTRGPIFGKVARLSSRQESRANDHQRDG